MENIHGNTHLIDTKEHDTENNEVQLDEYHDETNDDLIPDKEL